MILIEFKAFQISYKKGLNSFSRRINSFKDTGSEVTASQDSQLHKLRSSSFFAIISLQVAPRRNMIGIKFEAF